LRVVVFVVESEILGRVLRRDRGHLQLRFLKAERRANTRCGGADEVPRRIM
jgi:hypothetical protein